MLLKSMKKLWICSKEKRTFFEQFKNEDMFKKSFEEYDDSHDVAMKVIDEYKSSERKDYLEWGEKQNQSDEMNI